MEAVEDAASEDMLGKTDGGSSRSINDRQAGGLARQRAECNG